MIDAFVQDLITQGWAAAALRLAFVAVIYGFLFLVMRTTVLELNVAARSMRAPEGRGARMALSVLNGGETSLLAGEALMLRPTTMIGRAAGNEIVIDDPHVSARHAEIQFERGQWWLRDLASSNGTLLNDKPVRTVVAVRSGDVLQCGRVRFQFVPVSSVPSERNSV
jgi:hypothetical protein